MNKRGMYSFALMVSLLGLLSLSINIQNAYAPHLIITINADGSISPASANITTSNNVTYTFTAEINASIIIQRSNIVIDGDGWTLNGVDLTIMRGFNLTGVSNVTIKNLNILEFGYAMWLEETSQCVISNNTYATNEGGIWLISSTENTVSNNNISGSFEAVALYSSSHNNTISNNTLVDGYYGIEVRNCSFNLILGNKISETHDGIYTINSNDNTILKNDITNSSRGIRLEASSNNIISGNNITNNHDSIQIEPSSSHNEVIGNDLIADSIAIALRGNSNNFHRNNVTAKAIGFDIFGNYSIISMNNIMNCGTGFFFGGNTIHTTVSGNDIRSSDYGLYSEQASNHTIVGNYITNNTYGVYLDGYSHNMRIFHNTFSNNTSHMVVSNPDRPNFLDNGVEGNYWDNYTGVDLDRDGIGDSPHVTNSNNTDNYPLMGMFHSFNTSLGKFLNIISNSTVDNFQYEAPGMIRFQVTNKTANQIHGFCRVCIPYEVLSEPFNVTIDGAHPTYWNYTIYDNGTHKWIYFEYEHSTLEIVIVPEFPSHIILLMFIIMTFPATIIYRRKQPIKVK
jgi:parallel beta-helix repeat protein